MQCRSQDLAGTHRPVDLQLDERCASLPSRTIRGFADILLIGVAH